MDMHKRIGILLGGGPPGRVPSLRAGDAVLGALRGMGHEATSVFVDREVDLALRQERIDVAFIATRGRYGGDGCLQGLLELLGIPYTGSGVLASSLAMNREKTKEVLRLHNLPTAPAYVIRAGREERVADAHGSFGFPVVVRPVRAPSPLGFVVASDEIELEAAVEEAFRRDDEVLVERHVEGRRVTVGILDGLPLGMRGGAPKDTSTRQRSLLRLATAVYEALGCEGAACVDLLVNDRFNEVVLNVDTQPSLVPTDSFARIAQGAGLKFEDIVREILTGARLRAHGHRDNRRTLQLAFEGPDRRATAATAH